jgi:hypothetical protein
VRPDPTVNTTPRKAAEADLVDVEALVASAYEKYIARIGRKPKPMLADYRNALADHELWVLEDLTFYSRLGYRETHREQFPDRVVVHMAKPVLAGYLSR